MRRTILILGAGVMQLPALRLARGEGWNVLVADGNPDAVGRELADEFVHIDLRDRDGLLRYAAMRRRTKGLDGVFTTGTDFSTSVAWVADQLGLPGVDYRTALVASDKELMRRRLQERGVTVPRFRVLGEIPSDEESRDICDQIATPLVVKPVDSMGSRGVRRVDEVDELRPAVLAAHEQSVSGRVIVEEQIDGPEFSVDAIVWRGEISFCGIADRDIRFAPWFIEVGHTMPTDAPESTVGRLKELFVAAVRAIGIANGAAKGDLFIGRDGPVVGEIAARLSGGYMSGWTYPYASGVEPTMAGLRVAVGDPPGDLRPRHDLVSAERAVVSIPGRVRSVSGFDSVERNPGVRQVFQRCKAGDRVVFPRNNVEKCGNVITAAATREAALTAAEGALQQIEIVLDAGDAESVRFLFNDGSGLFSDSIAAYPGLMRVLRRGWRGEIGFEASEAGFGPTALRRFAAEGSEKDWNGRTLLQTVQLLAPRWSAQRGSAPSAVPMLWRAVAKGGLQGGRFFLDTMKETPQVLRG